ncbi:MAG: hypothetical protein BZY87_06370 [SAR202 cluster bacterium Io17-Chloro-G6]|nr:MAG: hypothetical protein BZY87_06370 [SAR202 cluster bacterium Io17-Chloro-G6]
MKSFNLILLIAVIITAAVACASENVETGVVAAEPGSVEIRISGAGGTTGVLRGLADEYSKVHTDLSFKFLEGSGSGGGVKGVTGDVLDLGAMSRRPQESEIETGIKYITFAEERVAVVTSPDLPLSNLTVEQVRAIFTGEIDNWASIGGPDALIRLIVREEEDSNTKIMRTGILGDTPFSKTAVLMTSESDAKDALNQATNAIGYLAYSGVVSGALSVNPVALDGLHPADSGGDYPLPSRSLGVAFLPEKFNEVQGFVDFITGSVVKGILAKQGLLAVR